MLTCPNCGTRIVTRKTAKADKRKARKSRTANVRFEVMRRDEDTCVVCRALATDMHHLVSGSGARRTLETAKTCASVCRSCHDLAHRNDLTVLGALHSWAKKRGYSFAAGAIERRISKKVLRAIR